MQNQWYIARDGKQYGPVTDQDLAQLVQDRELLDGDYLWRNGFDNWLPAAQVAEVRELASKNVVLDAKKVGTYRGQAMSLALTPPANGHSCAILIQEKRRDQIGPIIGAGYCS